MYYMIVMLLELERLHWSEIYSDIRRATLGRNFEVTIGRAAWESCSATWNLGTNSAFTLGRRKTTENLNRVCEILVTCRSIYSPVRTSQEAHSVSIK
jgi:hypothetical protein